MNRLLSIIYIAAAIIDYGSGYESGHCKEFGIDYKHGEEIYSKRLEIPEYCSGLFCLNSKIIYVPKYQCGRKDKVPLSTSVDFDPIKTTMSLKKRMTLQPFIPFPPTLLPTTRPTPRPTWCYYGGCQYKPDEKNYESTTTNECLYSAICDENGRLRIEWEPGCPRITPPRTTLPPQGCYYNGKYYQLGEIMYRGPVGGQGNYWCHAIMCTMCSKGRVASFRCPPALTPARITTTTSMAPPVIHVG